MLEKNTFLAFHVTFVIRFFLIYENDDGKFLIRRKFLECLKLMRVVHPTKSYGRSTKKYLRKVSKIVRNFYDTLFNYA